MISSQLKVIDTGTSMSAAPIPRSHEYVHNV